jgi:carboxylesterase type B
MKTLTTPFGIFKGKHVDAVVQYLGIPYATLENQLSVPEMVTSYKSVVDAMQYG